MTPTQELEILARLTNFARKKHFKQKVCKDIRLLQISDRVTNSDKGPLELTLDYRNVLHNDAVGAFVFGISPQGWQTAIKGS